jgi:hypothetical protein
MYFLVLESWTNDDSGGRTDVAAQKASNTHFHGMRMRARIIHNSLIELTKNPSLQLKQINIVINLVIKVTLKLIFLQVPHGPSGHFRSILSVSIACGPA